MNLSARQMLAHYEHTHGITPDRDEPPPERTTERVPEVDRAIARFEAEERRRREPL